MSIIDNIRQRVADAIQPKRDDSPRQRGRSNRDIGATSTGNELQASIRGTVFACLQHRANALSAIKFPAFIEKNYSLEELGQSHWANRLLANPNPYFTRSQVFSYIENWLSINGNAFIWTPTNGYRVPLQMWVLNPTRMRVIRGTDNFIEGYVYQSAQEGNIAIPEKEVIHLARLHPASRREEIIGMNIFGVGLVQAALDYANIDKDASAFLSRLFQNNAVPPLIAKFPERYDIDEWDKLKARWNEELPDYKLRALLAGGLELELPPKSEITASYDGISADTRSQIAQVFGVPPGMLTGEYQNRATAEVQWAIFRQNTIDPEALYIAEEFTRHFRRWEDSVLIQAEPYIFEDPVAKIQREEFELRWGIKTINDARSERGYDKVTDGNVPLIGNGYVPLSQATYGFESSLEVVAENNQRALTSRMTTDDYLTAELKQRDIYWRQFDGITLESALTIETIVSKAIAEINVEMASRLELGDTDFTDIDFKEETYTKYYSAVKEACSKIQSKMYEELALDKKDIPVTVTQSAENAAQESVALLRNSRDVIKREIQQLYLGSAATEDPAKMAKLLQAKFKSLSKSRAETIARTTSSNATSATQHSVMKANKVKMMWLSQRDGAVRSAHLDADGQIADNTGYFTVGGERTERPLGSGLSVKNVVNCRCQLFPVRG